MTASATWKLATFLVAGCALSTGAMAQNACANPLYLTVETGHMGVAPLVAEVLKRQGIKATFFASNERTLQGDGSLGNYWAPWWKARAAEGHEFASLTYDHVYWRGDVRGVEPRFRVQPSAGAFQGREFTWDAAKYCSQIAYAAERLQDFTGKKPLPLFRAPGGKTSARLLASAKACGYAHVGWSPAGLVEGAPLNTALRDIRSGDILLVHLGSATRQESWAPAALEPLLVGLKAKGFCFQTLREHPTYTSWIAAQGS